MRESEILATTYGDVCKVTRGGRHDRYKADSPETLYKNLKCAVSFSSGSTDGQGTEMQRINYVATLFARPDVKISAGDKIEVTLGKTGITREFEAGEGVCYPSHIEVPLIRVAVA